MITENQIHDLSLEGRQKLFIDLKSVKPSDRDYARCQALIGVVKATKGWKEPTPIKCRVTRDCGIDEVRYATGQEVSVFIWQYHALSRFLEAEEEIAGVKNQETLDAEKAEKKKGGGAGAVVALLLVLGSLFFGGRHANGQITNNTGGVQYGPAFIGGTGATTWAGASITNTWSLNGGTNNIVATNGNQYNQIVALTKYDLFSLDWGFALSGSGTSNVTTFVDESDDALHWTNLVTWVMAANGTNPVYGLYNASLFAPGYIRVTGQNNTNTQPVTNNFMHLAVKSSRAGN